MKIYITFGQVHTHRVNENTFDCNCVAIINARNEEEGRKLAFDYFGPKWHNSYHESDFNNRRDEIMKYYPRGLIEVNPED